MREEFYLTAVTATENNLDNLVAIIDCNGFQNDGKISKNGLEEYLQ